MPSVLPAPKFHVIHEPKEIVYVSYVTTETAQTIKRLHNHDKRNKCYRTPGRNTANSSILSRLYITLPVRTYSKVLLEKLIAAQHVNKLHDLYEFAVCH